MNFASYINWIIDNPKGHRFVYNKILSGGIVGEDPVEINETVYIIYHYPYPEVSPETYHVKHRLTYKDNSEEVKNEYGHIIGKVSDFNFDKLFELSKNSNVYK